MRALHYDGPFRVSVQPKPDPIIEHPQDGIVRVTCAAFALPLVALGFIGRALLRSQQVPRVA